MRESYLYWYPVDFRNSGKDLIQNHLAFMLFTHTALLPEEHWPQGYGVNGHVTVDGQKMSKSLGNVIPVRAMIKEYGADASRLTMMNGGEGMDDPNWDSELAKGTRARFAVLLDLCHAHRLAKDNREALEAALQDLPRQAMRLARWRMRQEMSQNPSFKSPLRPGRPPGHRRRATHAIDELLSECQWLAHYAAMADTS